MQSSQPGVMEYQLGAHFSHACSMEASPRLAYGSIVAGGDNACILHYENNNQPLLDGDLVLIDAGCEIDYYAADITRTFPVNGCFSEPQKQIYNIVLEALEAAIAVVKDGVPVNAMQDAAVQVITQGLVDLGILKGDVTQLIKEEAYKPFYLHGVGHWLGMDVHDVGQYKIDGQWRPLRAGMVTTVEPGIYIAADTADVDARWLGIGVRIEDNIVVTNNGHENFTRRVPVTVDAIEALMQNAE
jgi:Xaa-Pro aminopeptidase